MAKNNGSIERSAAWRRISNRGNTSVAVTAGGS